MPKYKYKVPCALQFGIDYRKNYNRTTQFTGTWYSSDREQDTFPNLFSELHWFASAGRAGSVDC